jgi:hypothetical protein
MKKTLVTFLMLFSIAAYSQTERGTVMVGGSAGFSKSKSTSTIGQIDEIRSETTSASFSPGFAYFVANRFAIGLTLSLAESRNEVDEFGLENRQKSLGVGPTLRYYIPLAEQWAVFPTASYAYQTSVTKSSQNTPGGGVVYQEDKTKGSALNGGAGITYFINKSIGIEGLLIYQATAYSDNEFSSNGLAFNVGFRIYFPKQ